MFYKIYDLIRYCYIDKVRQRLIFDYWPIIEKIRHNKLTLLEIGIWKGDSLRYWAHFFKNPETKIIGIDINLPDGSFHNKVVMCKCNQNDSDGLKNIAEKYGAFDIIIDDGFHKKKETENCFNVLWNYVAPGGYYVIEDWTAMEDAEVIKKISKNKSKLGISEERIVAVAPRIITMRPLYIAIPGKCIAFFKKQ
ncbi:MAG TPA: class I SAM-dependent methyltransferase [Dehalococcoidia bacterium]|nr:class I SAM-dependent methyltransferase [Dehalococcoidia bacterium]